MSSTSMIVRNSIKERIGVMELGGEPYYRRGDSQVPRVKKRTVDGRIRIRRVRG